MDVPRADPDEFEQFFRREYAGVVRMLVPITGDRSEAEAVAQEAFLTAFGRWRRIGRYDRPGAWVQRVAIRDAVRGAERGRRHRELADTWSAPVDDPAGRVDLARGLATLSPRQRAAVVLHHLAGWPVADVAAALGCAEPTVRVHLHRGRAALAITLALDSDEPADEEVHDEA